MKKIHTIAAFGLAAALAGCTTSSQVREMIDASQQDYLEQLDVQQGSIGVLKQSARAGLEKSADNAKRLDALERQVTRLAQQMVEVQDIANASKVMSAANTVKVSNLEEKMALHEEQNAEDIARMTDIDRLYEEVLIRQFQEIANSANAAIKSLREDGYSATTNAPVELDAPIVIVAPDTTVPTNNSETNR